MGVDWVLEEIEGLKRRKLYRFLRNLSTPTDHTVVINGKRVVNLSSNNYLGLAASREVISLVEEGMKRWGFGSGASRLIVGNFEVHREAEAKLAEFKGKEDALLFSSGYMANLSLITALSDGNTEIFSDELNHASIVDGCRLSRAKVSIYKHRDVSHLEALLKRSKAKRKLVVTDGVFSMDGDVAPLKDIAFLKEKYGFLFIVDDAHGTGVMGSEGRGVVHREGVVEEVDAIMGTLGKALGLFGAFVASSRDIVELLINRARPFIYTTALPPCIAYAVIGVLEIVKKAEDLRRSLMERASFLKKGIEDLGFSTLSSETQIVPLLVGDEEKVMKLSSFLMDKGFFAHGIRPPTVPPGTSRIRVSVMANHRWEDLKGFLDALEEAREVLWRSLKR